MHFKHYENPYSGLAQYVNCAAANPGADAGMYDASEQYKLSTIIKDHFGLNQGRADGELASEFGESEPAGAVGFCMLRICQR